MEASRDFRVSWRAVAGALACAAFALASGAACAEQAASAWDAYESAFIEWYFTANPTIAAAAGRHEFDGRLPDWSAAGVQAVVDRLHEERKRASAFADEGLSTAQRFERDYVLAQIDGDLYWLESARWPFRNPAYYIWTLDPDIYLTREYAPLAQRMRAYIAYARAIPGAAAQIRGNLGYGMPRTYVALAHLQFGGYAHFYEADVPAVFAAVDDPKLQAEFRAANAGAARAMRELDAWVGTQEAAAGENFAIGAAAFADMLWATERLRVPLARLEQIAQQDLARNQRALAEACAQIAPGRTLADCVAADAARKPEGSPVEAARRQLDELKSFVRSHDLVSIPADMQAQVRESPEYQRWNMAYISIPGTFDADLPSIYYISPPDAKWSKAEQEAYLPGRSSLLFTSVHEVWPGHFLQYLHANRGASKAGRIFASYAYNEGWAHYAEELMWEAGLGDGAAETHVGQLVEALLRNVRLVSVIGLQSGRMTVAQSEAMFREVAFQDPGNARQQAARGTFDPAYGNYTLGKLMIRKMRDEWCASRGGRAAWRRFHDAFLSYGAPPIPLVRKQMLGDDSALF